MTMPFLNKSPADVDAGASVSGQVRRYIKPVLFGLAAVVALSFGAQTVGSVTSGTYHILQMPVTGTMKAEMNPGMYMRAFSAVTTFPVSDTYFFTKDAIEGKSHDQSIEVVFADGSEAWVSGTTRVILPRLGSEAIGLVTEKNFHAYDDLEEKFIKPIVRNALVLTANFMTARESYSERKAEFLNYARDQIEHGIYKTREKEITDIDPVTLAPVKRKAREIVYDEKTGLPMREVNPLDGTGISLANFEIKKIYYSDRVTQQIAKQQELAMAVSTSRAEAEKAEQEKRTAQAQGEARVTEAKYKKEQEKIGAVVDAQKEKEVAITAADKEKQVAITGAEQKKAVADLDRQAAEQIKLKLIAEGQGEAEKRQLIMQADGALAQKLEALKAINKDWAEAYARRGVPTVVMGGASGNGAPGETTAGDFMSLLTAKAAKDLALDLQAKVPGQR